MIDDKMPVAAGAVDLPHFYFNGFQLSIGNSDATAVMMINNNPSFSVSMSYTTAKSLQFALTEIIDTLERVTDHKIMTSNDVGERMKVHMESLGSQ